MPAEEADKAEAGADAAMASELEDAAHRSLAWCLCSRLKPQDPTPRVARQMQITCFKFVCTSRSSAQAEAMGQQQRIPGAAAV
jgi:hypothetical protein